MKKFSDKFKHIADEATDLIEKIMRWRQMKLDELLHVKYEPHKKTAKSQFDAILADVNENPQKVEEVLKIHSITDSITRDNIIEALNEITLTDDEKAEIEHKKRLKKQKEINAFQDSIKSRIKK